MQHEDQGDDTGSGVGVATAAEPQPTAAQSSRARHLSLINSHVETFSIAIDRVEKVREGVYLAFSDQFPDKQFLLLFKDDDL